MSKSSILAKAIVVALLAGLAWWLVSGGDETNTAEPAPSPSVTATVPTVEMPSPEPPAVENPYRVKVPDDFTNRVLDFEEAYLMRARPDGLARLAPFATERYLQSHTRPAGNKYALPGSDLIVTVSRDLNQTEVVVTGSGQDPNVRYVSIQPFVTESRTGSDGSISPTGPPYLSPEIDATTWRLDNGIWEVDSDR